MADSVMAGLGDLSGILGIIQFFLDNVPGDAPPEGATIRVKAGNPGDDNPGVDGDVAACYAWDINNNYLGQSDGAHLDVGGSVDLTIDSFSPGSRADFVGVAVDDDALCIAWVTVTQYDGSDGGAWTGDIGYDCGQHWYYQTEMAGWIDEDQTQAYIPHCTWLDANHDGDVPSAALKFRSLSYGSDVQATADDGSGCTHTIFGPDNGPINDAPGKRTPSKPRPRGIEETLVVSNITQHDAKKLCDSPMSLGPDFVDSKGLFCDMSSKKMSPVCSANKVDGCVEIDTGKKQVTKRAFGPKRAASHVHKSYAHLKQWN